MTGRPIETYPETDTVWLGIQGYLPWIGSKLPGGQWGRIQDLGTWAPPTHWMPIFMPDPPEDFPLPDELPIPEDARCGD